MATAPIAFCRPLRPRISRKCEARYVSVLRAAACAAWVKAVRSHLEPGRVLPDDCLPADS